MDWKLWKLRLLKFIVKDHEINPIEFLVQILFIHMYGGIQYSSIIFVFGLIYTLFFEQNYFWHVGIIITPKLGMIVPLNLIFGFISCNEQWKTILFLYCLGDFMFIPYSELDQLYNILALSGLLYINYYRLTFKNIKENTLFFPCLSVIWVFEIILFLNSLLQLGEGQRIYMIILIIPATLLASVYIIQRQINRVLNSKLESLEQPSLVIHFIENMQKRMNDSLQCQGIQLSHTSYCRDVDCLCCHSKGDFSRLYLRQLYQRGFKKFEKTQYDDCLQQFYVTHLIKEKKLLLAMQITLQSKVKRHSIFKQVMQKRVELLLQEELQKIQPESDDLEILKNPFSYDESYDQLKRKLLELIETKISYWYESSKKQVKISILRQLGRVFLQKLSSMNEFYIKNIQNIENKVYCHSGSIIYNLFLLTATNYKQMAESNIKELKKIMDSSSTSAQLHMSYKYYVVKVSLHQERVGVIENMNKSFPKLMSASFSKLELIGTKIDQMIPLPYLERHLHGMKMIRIQGKGKYFGTEINPLFVLSSGQHLVPCSLNLRYTHDFINQFSAIAVLKQIKSEHEYIMLDEHGKFAYATEGSNDYEILQMEEVKELILKFQEKWRTVNQIDPIYFSPQNLKIQVKINYSTFTIEIFTKMAQAFRFPTPPPILISIHNQTQTYFLDDQVADDIDANCLQKLNNVIDQVQTESQTSSTNHRNEIIRILSSYQKNSSFRSFNILYVGVFLLFAVVSGGLVAQDQVVDLSWIEIKSGESNPIKLLEALYFLQLEMNWLASKGLSLYSIKSGILAQSYYDEAFGIPSYWMDSKMQMTFICGLVKSALSDDMVKNNLLSSQQFQQALNRKLWVNTTKSSQQIFFSSILRMFISDCYVLSSLEPDATPIPEIVSIQSFWHTIFPHMFVLIQIVSTYCLSNLLLNYNINYILFGINFCLIVLAAIPTYLTNKRIQGEEDYIFELMSSLEPELLHHEVNQLIDLEGSLKCKLTTTFDVEKDRLSFLPNGTIEPDEIKSENRSLMENRRKKSVQLVKDSYERPRLFFACSLFLGLGFLLLIFLLKNRQIIWLHNTLANKITQSEWRNERLNLVLNLKKKAFAFQPNDTVNGKPVEEWIKNAITHRKLNYEFNDTIIHNNLVFCLQNAGSPLCGSPALSSEMTINLWEETLFAITAEDGQITRVPFLQLLESESFFIYFFREPSRSAALVEAITEFRMIGRNVFISGGALMTILGLATIYYLRKIKITYVLCLRTIAFLSENMIKKNKRVESYLQNLAKLD